MSVSRLVVLCKKPFRAKLQPRVRFASLWVGCTNLPWATEEGRGQAGTVISALWSLGSILHPEKDSVTGLARSGWERGVAVFLSGKAQGSMRGKVEEGSLETPAPVAGWGRGGVWS